MIVEKLQAERQKLNEHLKHLNAILLFAEIIDYIKISPSIEKLELCQSKKDNHFFVEDGLFINLTGPTYKNWTKEPVFSFFGIENLTLTSALVFPLPMKNEGLIDTGPKISFDKNSELGDMLQKYTLPETYALYVKEWLEKQVEEKRENTALKQIENKIKHKI